MAVSVSKAGPYYSSGEIKFSSLRSNFRAQIRKTTSSGSESFNSDTGEIKASELLRNTNTSTTNPVVPNATENANISTSSNWKTSQFRDSVKFYYVVLPSSDDVTNFDIDSQSWNSNLDKNIVKVMFIDGVCGSNSTSSYAATFDSTAYNLTLDVYGSILGAGGRGGGTSGAPAISGESGGNALYVASSSGNNISVLVRSGSRIYGGGGGGEKGVDGTAGTNGTCRRESIRQYCAGSPDSGCNEGYYVNTRRPGCCVSTMRGGCVQSVYQNLCYVDRTTYGGSAGIGGNGGNGQGYNLTKSNGVAGTSGGAGDICYDISTPSATNGTDGGNGADGGDWASSGGDTTNSGSGGFGARAISGSNYVVTGTIDSSTVKGAYNP